MLGQFHNDGDNPPAFTFENQGVLIPGSYWLEVDSYVGGNNNNPKLLIDQKDMLGKWTDMLVNAKWTNNKDGFFSLPETPGWGVELNEEFILSHPPEKNDDGINLDPGLNMFEKMDWAKRGQSE